VTGDCKGALALLLAAGLAAAASARADQWDLGGDPDNAFTTDNVLAHGAEQVHDLAALPGPVPDQDWYLAPAQPFSSYQFVVDGLTGRLDLPAAGLQRLSESGSAVLQSAEVLELGGVLSLAWLGPATPAPAVDRVRVQGAACGTSCVGSDRYRVRFFDTTYTIARFNNSTSQSTVLLVQNATDRTCALTAYFVGPTGALLGSASVASLAAYQLVVLATAATVPNLSGSVTIAHTCGYGGLSGKAVSVEPATGFTFDTAMVSRPGGGTMANRAGAPLNHPSGLAGRSAPAEAR
jgi:hypothetical protein